MQQPENQQRGPRSSASGPANPQVADRRPDHGGERRRPRPAADAAAGARARGDGRRCSTGWADAAQGRTGAARHRRVRLDGRPGRPRPTTTKLDLAKQAADRRARPVQDRRRGRPAGVLHRPRRRTAADFADLVPIGADRPTTAERARSQHPPPVPDPAAPRCTTWPAKSYDDALAGYDPTRINAVVLLTDGRNDDGTASDDNEQLDRPRSSHAAGRQRGRAAQPVRLFTIGYGADADLDVLRQSPRPPTPPTTTPATPDDRQGVHQRDLQLLSERLRPPAPGCPARSSARDRRRYGGRPWLGSGIGWERRGWRGR